MAEYIKREAAVKAVEKYGLTNGVVWGRHTGLAICIASEIADIPTADVVPVVRCMDCKHLMNGEAIIRENVIANLKADADALRNKLADTEAALGRANACIATMKVERDQQTKDLFQWRSSAQALHDDLLDARDRANYAEAHPCRNLWAWLKRKLVRHE
nr:MAG TPA: hypothetical protein [Caudoviricetes sp.]